MVWPVLRITSQLAAACSSASIKDLGGAIPYSCCWCFSKEGKWKEKNSIYISMKAGEIRYSNSDALDRAETRSMGDLICSREKGI